MTKSAFEYFFFIVSETNTHKLIIKYFSPDSIDCLVELTDHTKKPL